MSHCTDFSRGLSPGQVERVNILSMYADRFREDDRPRLDDLIFQAAEDNTKFCPKAEKEIGHLVSVFPSDSDDE